jgi:hypothetical protein
MLMVGRMYSRSEIYYILYVPETGGFNIPSRPSLLKCGDFYFIRIFQGIEIDGY